MCLAVIQHDSYFTELEHFLLGNFWLSGVTSQAAPPISSINQNKVAAMQNSRKKKKKRKGKMLQVFVGGTRFFNVLAGFSGVWWGGVGGN